MLPILFTLLGMYRAPKLEHPLNVQLGISFMPLPIFIVCKDTQYLNASNPIFSTLSGIIIERREEHFSNIELPNSTLFPLQGSTTVLSDVQP